MTRVDVTRVDAVSKNDSIDRVRGPELAVATSLGKSDDALVIGLIKPDTDTEPTLVIGDGILDDAQADAIATAVGRLGATGAHGEVTRLPAPDGLPVDLVVAVGLGESADVDDAERLRQAAATGKTPTTGETPIIQRGRRAILQGIF